MPVRRVIRVRLRRWARSLVRLRASPREIAAGFALGLFIGWTPTFGIQLLLAVFLATVCRVNRISCLAGVWITNVFTVVPFYTAAWRVGSWVLQAFGWGRTPAGEERLRSILRFVSDESFWSQTLTKLRDLLRVGGELWLGAILIGAATAAVGYTLMLRLVVGQRALAAQRRARRRKALERAAGASDS